MTVGTVQYTERTCRNLHLDGPPDNCKSVIDDGVGVPQTIGEDAPTRDESIRAEPSRQHRMKVAGSVGIWGWLQADHACLGQVRKCPLLDPVAGWNGHLRHEVDPA